MSGIIPRGTIEMISYEVKRSRLQGALMRVICTLLALVLIYLLSFGPVYRCAINWQIAAQLNSGSQEEAERSLTFYKFVEKAYAPIFAAYDRTDAFDGLIDGYLALWGTGMLTLVSHP